MKRRYLNFLVILVIAATIMAAVTGCNLSKEDESSMEDLSSAVSWYEDVIESTQTDENSGKEDDKREIVVVIPAGCGAKLFYGADFLSDEMSKYVGYDVEVEYDSEFKGSSKNTEILIGSTNRAESIKYLKKLRSNDYGYGYIDDSVVIGAHTEELCVKAINAFAECLSDDSTDLTKINTLKPYEVRKQYGISEIKLCDFPIYEYDIVYPSDNSMSEKALANILRDKIANYSGYCLRVISEKQSTDATRAICIGKTSLSLTEGISGKATISVNADGNIELISDKNAGIYHAIEQFVDIIKQSENASDGKCIVELEGERIYSYNSEGISLYIMRNHFATSDVEEFKNTVMNAKSSSLAIFDSPSDDVKDELCENIGNPTSVKERSCYYVDDTTQRCVYAESVSASDSAELLTLIIERSDGKRFVFIGGFCDGDGNEELLLKLNEECQKYADLPVVVAHELGEKLDRSFAEANPRLSAVATSCGLYFSADTFVLGSAPLNEVLDSAVADILRLDFYYS